ncbi:glycogen synthase GlgA [Acetobacteraceae bacterium H6797]|nr:glycogen synthase GlgA [Acetobacteraceae bacterium H6797]
MKPLRVLAVASEVYPLIKTGGLADVVGALPGALAAQKIKVTTLVPGYPAIMQALQRPRAVHVFEDLFGAPARLLSAKAGGLDLLVIDAAHLYNRPGNPYNAPHGGEWGDNAQRFAALGMIGAMVGRGIGKVAAFDLVHAHDWHAGLTPAYMRFGPPGAPPCVFTIHNLAFQGKFPLELAPRLGLPPEAVSIDGVEYYGTLGFLKAGLQCADWVTTVSPSYAAEIRMADHGMGLDGLLRHREATVTGILNGIDDDVWNPETDEMIPMRYTAQSVAKRAENKRALQERLGLEPDPEALVFGAVSRLTWQKGFDLLLGAMPKLLAQGAQLAMLGGGDPEIENGFRRAAAFNPGRVGVTIGYDESLAHLVQAGSDAIVLPSRFEPCGLTQLCALRYGALPLVAHVGGLADTVIDANEAALSMGAGTGFIFSPVTVQMLEAAIERCARLWQDKANWRKVQANALSSDVSWRRPAAQYAALFRRLTAA